MNAIFFMGSSYGTGQSTLPVMVSNMQPKCLRFQWPSLTKAGSNPNRHDDLLPSRFKGFDFGFHNLPLWVADSHHPRCDKAWLAGTIGKMGICPIFRRCRSIPALSPVGFQHSPSWTARAVAAGGRLPLFANRLPAGLSPTGGTLARLWGLRPKSACIPRSVESKLAVGDSPAIHSFTSFPCKAHR